MSKSKVKKFLKNSLTISTVIIIATVDTILAIFKTPVPYIIIVSLIIALGISLAYFDERINKLDKSFNNLKKRLNKMNKKGMSQLIIVILVILLILLILAVLTGTPNLATELLGMNITAIP